MKRTAPIVAAIIMAAAGTVAAQESAPEAGPQAGSLRATETGADATAVPAAVPVEAEWPEAAKGFVASLKARRGTVRIDSASVTLNVPENFYFLGPADARKVLEQAWENPPDEHVLGMLFPADVSPLHPRAWGVTLYFQNDGYVRDEDAGSIDYDALLEQMRKDVAEANKAREKQGFDKVELIGWAARPTYDRNTRKLYWAKELKFGDNEIHTLNYDIRALGRHGVLVLSFIADMKSLPEIESNLNTVLNMISFQNGARYSDFDPDIDEVAAYGIGGLIAGKVLAKTGFFALALVFLKKFWFVILAGLGGAFAWLRGLFFGGARSGSSEG